MLAEFQKTDRCIWFSHLDLQRTMQRALRRAQLPIAYSQGFNPHAELSFASALPVGVSSLCEILDVRLDGELAPEAFVQAMNGVLPRGLRICAARLVEDRFPAPMAKMAQAGYEALAFGADLRQAARDFLASQRFEVKKPSKGKVRQLDIRPMVQALDVELQGEDSRLTLLVTCTNADNLKPELLLEALCPGGRFQVTRTRLLAHGGAPLFAWTEA